VQKLLLPSKRHLSIRDISSIYRKTRKEKKTPNPVAYLGAALLCKLSCFSLACPCIPVDGPEFPNSALPEQLCSSQETLLEPCDAGLEKTSIHRLAAAAVCKKSRQLIKESTR